MIQQQSVQQLSTAAPPVSPETDELTPVDLNTDCDQFIDTLKQLNVDNTTTTTYTVAIGNIEKTELAAKNIKVIRLSLIYFSVPYFTEMIFPAGLSA